MFIPRKMSHAVERVARQSIGKDWELYAALLERWQEIVGLEYAEATTPVKIAFPHQPQEARRRNGALTIRLPKGLVLEFSCKTEQMRARINAYFGYDAIGRIVFDPAFVLPRKAKVRREMDIEAKSVIREGTLVFDGKELREALHSFGEAIFTSKSVVE